MIGEVYRRNDIGYGKSWGNYIVVVISVDNLVVFRQQVNDGFHRIGTFPVEEFKRKFDYVRN